MAPGEPSPSASRAAVTPGSYQSPSNPETSGGASSNGLEILTAMELAFGAMLIAIGIYLIVAGWTTVGWVLVAVGVLCGVGLGVPFLID